MKGIIESILDDEDVVLDRMSSNEDKLLWQSTRQRYNQAMKRRVNPKNDPIDHFSRIVSVEDWVLYGFGLWRIVDIKFDDKMINMESSDGRVQDISYKDFTSYVKIMDKAHFAKNLSA